MTLPRAALLAGASLACAFSITMPAAAQDYPVRPIRIIVPYAAGGPTDLIARVVARRLSTQLGQSIVIENRAGAGTVIGTRAALAAPPDGYTLLLSTSTMGIAPLVSKSAGYRYEEIRLLSPIAFDGFVTLVHPSVPVGTIQEFVAYAKARPGKLNFGSPASGGPADLLIDRLSTLTGLDLVKINYSGGAATHKDLIAGNVQVIMAAPGGWAGAHKAGQVRPLAFSGERRSRLFPETPTYREAGYPSIVGGAWFAVSAAAKISEPVAQKLMREGLDAINAQEVKDQLLGMGLEAWPGSMQDFLAFTKQDFALWEADIKRMGLQRD